MTIIFSIIAFLFIVFIGGRLNLNLKFKKEVASLFSQSKPIQNKIFTYSQLIGLPEPVQRYFKLIMKEGQPYISYVRMTHNGQFKTGANKSWINIDGEQYATTQKPGFIWKGTTTLFIAKDMFIGNAGRLVVTILSLINVVDGKGKAYNQGELLRWLGESVLYPTNLLPSQNLHWEAIDHLHAKFTFNYNGLSLFYLVTFNEAGEIIELETKRYMDSMHIETWIIKLANYKEMNKVTIPTVFEVLWRLKSGDLSYAKFNMTKVEYDNPTMF